VKRFNIHSAQTDLDPEDPDGYRAGSVRFGPSIGASAMGGSVYDLPPGESVCPYHYEWDEEWLIVLTGRPVVRHPGGEDQLDPGDVVCFPKGPTGAHKVSNPAAARDGARVLMFSTVADPAVAIYPDSDKVGVFIGEERLLLWRGSGVGYYDGEV
jgi:uncharacterized cupin superfamily protein